MSSVDNETDLQDFADMSAALTGFTSEFLRPELDPVNLTKAYYDMAVSQQGLAAVQSLLNAYRAIVSQPAQAIADQLLETSSKSLSANALLAQSIVNMWYLGAWYAPGVMPVAAVQVVSSMAYTHSLVWNVAQAHPMGFSEWTFGYWTTPSGPLSQFGVNVGGGK